MRSRSQYLDWRREDVAGAALRPDELRLAWVDFELAPQSQNLDVHAAIEHFRVVHAAGGEQLLAAQYLLRRRRLSRHSTKCVGLWSHGQNSGPRTYQLAQWSAYVGHDRQPIAPLGCRSATAFRFLALQLPRLIPPNPGRTCRRRRLGWGGHGVRRGYAATLHCLRGLIFLPRCTAGFRSGL